MSGGKGLGTQRRMVCTEALNRLQYLFCSIVGCTSRANERLLAFIYGLECNHRHDVVAQNWVSWSGRARLDKQNCTLALRTTAIQ